jgi:hypothetical protein
MAAEAIGDISRGRDFGFEASFAAGASLRRVWGRTLGANRGWGRVGRGRGPTLFPRFRLCFSAGCDFTALPCLERQKCHAVKKIPKTMAESRP